MVFSIPQDLSAGRAVGGGGEEEEEVEEITRSDDASSSGGDASEHHRVTPKRSRITREDFLAMLASRTPPARGITSDGVNSGPLQAAFLELWLPQINRNRASMQMAQQWFSNQTANFALARSAKAVALATLSREYRSQRLMHAAVQMHSAALFATRRQFTTRQFAVLRNSDDKITLAGISHMLAMAELLFADSLDDSRANIHTRITLYLIEDARANPDFDNSHPMLHTPTRLLAAWESLVARQLPPGVVASVDDTTAHPPASVFTISDLSVRTVSLLQRIDRVCASEHASSSRILNTFNEIIELENKVHAWMTNYYRSGSGSLYRFTAAAVDPRFGSRTSVFPVLYDFEDVVSCLLHIGYWMCLFALVGSQLKLSNRYPEVLDIESLQAVRIQSLAREYADNICMSVPFLGKRHCGWAGPMFAIRPLRCVMMYFREQSEWQKLSWCVACAADMGI